MRALVYLGDRTVKQQETPEPIVTDGEVVVQVLQAGICGTDLCVIRDERPKVAPPMTLGHEFVGRRRDTGEVVIVNPILSCQRCRACCEGRTHLCESRRIVGVHRPGAFAESVTVPVNRILPAGNATLEQAAMVDPIATALHAFRLASPPGGQVAVLGAGAIGLSMLFVLQLAGVQDITVTDISQQRLDLAHASGATRVGPVAEGVYDVVYDTAGTTATRREAVLKTRPGGTAVLVGLHSADLLVPAAPIIGGERSIRGSFGYTDDEFREAARLADKLDTRWVHVIPFDEAESILLALIKGRGDPSQVKIQMRLTS